VRQGGENSIWWTPSKRKKFEVWSFYQMLSSTPSGSSFAWKIIWRMKVPSRVSFFGQTMALGKILILDNLRKRKVIAVDWRCMCKKDGKSIGHFLLHCKVTIDLQTSIFCLLGIEWVMLRRVTELLDCWRG
jgi:hypothetical protein